MGASRATVSVTLPTVCSAAAAFVGYQIPTVNGGSVPFAIFTSSKPTLAAKAGVASRPQTTATTANSLTTAISLFALFALCAVATSLT
jgi:hypothetical protein